ncbi:E3 ubiquitin-protein ligase arih1 [Selaginella moellendorffii]|nr:E3 ubiquitin-protein ligase arih1 [Selaginella moellendorffii]|eukprot:XP_002972933.2 E3 ubiquitin-protein ligase arih1 [Selaginella moellendorffii]
MSVGDALVVVVLHCLLLFVFGRMVSRCLLGLAGWRNKLLGVEDDAALAIRVQEMELEALQKQEKDREIAAKLLKELNESADQLLHDDAMAREIDEMDEREWEENGDLYERPFQSGITGTFFRVYFKGYSVSEGGVIVGAALGGSIRDSSGNELLQLKRYVATPTGKNVAQYYALVDVLKSAQSMGARKIIAYTDSGPLHNQIKGYWRVSTKAMMAEYDKAIGLIDSFESFDINLALHGENWPADNVAKSVSISQRQNTASSSRSMFHCVICLEDVQDADIYTLTECSHKFCSSCVKQHVEATVTTGRTFPVACPQVECTKKFTEGECKKLLSEAALKVFMKKIEEERIPDAQRVYCPYPNCSDLMDRRTFLDPKPRKLCGACQRYFCLDCRVPWHTFSTCAGYQRLPLDLKDAADAKLYRLAENQKWRQCKKCRWMIELLEGCYHMTCRCGYEFCYTCGMEYRNKIQMCTCKLWDEHYIIREEEDFSDDGSASDEMDLHDPFYKTRLCRYFAKGHCRNGVNCRFAHGIPELVHVFVSRLAIN